MGNCLRHESPMTWAGDDWGSLEPEKLAESQVSSHHDELFDKETEEESLWGEKRRMSSSTEVKIRITKKQLEELLGKIDVQGLSVEQMLAQLMNVSDQYHTQQHRSWRPALQSIPECELN